MFKSSGIAWGFNAFPSELLDQFTAPDGKEWGWRGSSTCRGLGAAPGVQVIVSGSILSVDALLPNGRQLTAFWQEHDHKGHSGAAQKAAGNADVQVIRGREPREHP